MKDFLEALSKKLEHNTTAYENHNLHVLEPEALPKSDSKEGLKVNFLLKHIQKMLLECWVTWLCLPRLSDSVGSRYVNQVLYASIGWSVGATIGYAQAAPDKRVIACIGDGSFQTAA
ncbi:hypothetical protein LWI28_007690 [Acer negundo]|uniref:pyruvate decarboxylase n=1 Tax=Acer negundo TaxID=4023 RepID=A0AAD5I5T1_ACENE|nr:hypothetical protein LWI28_007690 [Acer negundo]